MPSAGLLSRPGQHCHVRSSFSRWVFAMLILLIVILGLYPLFSPWKVILRIVRSGFVRLRREARYPESEVPYCCGRKLRERGLSSAGERA